MTKYPSSPQDAEILIEANDVLFEESSRGQCKTIILNRPRKLNSLNISMIDKILQYLLLESKTQDSNLIIQKSSSSKAFCAGGDVVALAKANNAGFFANSIRLFESEYSLNYLYSRFKKPVVSLLDGITMGGGCGLSVHSPFRVITETTKLAMPEMAIGFFPDVGATYFFSRLDNYVGWYICLTGDVLLGYGNMLAGTGTHYVPRRKLQALENRLEEVSDNYGNIDVANINGYYHDWYMKVNRTIEEFSEDEPKGFEYQYSKNDLKIIYEMFENSSSIEEVFNHLENIRDNSSFAKQTLKKFYQRSLLSIKISYQALQFASKHDNYNTLEFELNLSKNINKNSDKLDIGEGIFKKLIFKTNDPDWKFKNIYDIPQSYLDKYCFAKIEPFGHIYRFWDNYGLYSDSMDYRLNKFCFPKRQTIIKYLNDHKDGKKSLISWLHGVYPQYRNKKGLEKYLGFVINQEFAKPKL